MQKAIFLLFALGVVIVANAQFTITCGNQQFVIPAKKLSTVKQVDIQTQAVTSTTYYYHIGGNYLQVWIEIADTVTRSFSLYEIKKEAIDQAASQQVVDYGQQDYTGPVKTLYIKCSAGKKDIAVTGYVDWTTNADHFSWSFIDVSSYNKTELDNMMSEINTWLKQ